MKTAKRSTRSYDFSKGRRGAILPRQGKTRITMWLDDGVLAWFRAAADREGQGYQTMLNAVLRSFASKEPASLRKIVREVVKEELVRRQAS